jgi:hypothetical protein
MSIEKDVTLICVDCVDANRAKKSIDICMSKVNFKNYFLLTDKDINFENKISIDSIKNIQDYSFFCLKNLFRYFSTSHCLIVQHDSWIINENKWDDLWLKYDYIGCNTGWTEKYENGKGGKWRI